MATHVLESPENTLRDGRRALAVAGGAHLLHDGYTDLIYLLLPIWQPEFSLSYAAVGVLRALHTGTMTLAIVALMPLFTLVPALALRPSSAP
jgi:hypothetical protein